MAALPSSKRAVSQTLQSVQQLPSCSSGWWVRPAWLWPECAGVGAAAAWPVCDPKASANGLQGNTSRATLSVTTVATRRRRKRFRVSPNRRIITQVYAHWRGTRRIEGVARAQVPTASSQFPWRFNRDLLSEAYHVRTRFGGTGEPFSIER